MKTTSLQQALLTVLVSASLALTAFAEDHATTDIGTLDKEAAAKAFPAKPPYSPYAGRNLPQGHIPLALLFFSIGVEAGHFLFVGLVLSAIALAVRVKLPAPRWVQLAPPYAIGTVAMFWPIQRVTAF